MLAHRHYNLVSPFSAKDYEAVFCYEYGKLWEVTIIIVINVLVVLYSYLINSLAQHDLHVYK